MSADKPIPFSCVGDLFLSSYLTKGHLDPLCRSSRTPLHMLEARVYSHPQSQESLQDYNQSAETAQYSTPYFIFREECHKQNATASRLQVSRLGANKQHEHIQPAWIAQNSKKQQVDIEIDTGAG